MPDASSMSVSMNTTRPVLAAPLSEPTVTLSTPLQTHDSLCKAHTATDLKSSTKLLLAAFSAVAATKLHDT
jgi:hypothetical protein